MADHLCPFVIIEDKKLMEAEKKSKHKTITIRVNKEENQKKFKETLAKISWEALENEEDINKKTEMLTDTINKAYDEAFPLKEVRFNKNRHAVEKFVTQGMLKSRTNFNNLHKEGLKMRDNQLLEAYTKKKRCLQKGLQKGQRRLFQETI